ncbi:pyrroline-5-carboxylate reductase family protein [Eupransor demetentiae]|uniref:Pyrroline-5-carboxylate reductase n=1 Tax=Eupransor demetentiae TaxID=3109584 RepID=A0ABP0EQA4_9LACO|nr:Pyrroline-5-carboxylate reductase (ProC) [Lactobacillaceae bacterium LMG 33000]
MKIAIIGVGSMGSAIVEGLNRQKVVPVELIGQSSSTASASHHAQTLNIPVFGEPKDVLAQQPDLLFFVTPAKQTLAIMQEFVNLSIPSGTIVLSAAAGVSNEAILRTAGNVPTAALIPNTAVAYNAGTIAYAPGKHLVNGQLDQVVNLLKTLGDVFEVKENQLDLAGVVGGCAPAFVDVFMAAMEDAAVSEGLSRATAREIISSMVKGSAQLAQASGKSYTELKDEVTSPGGTTIKGVLALEDNGFRSAVIKALLASNS